MSSEFDPTDDRESRLDQVVAGYLQELDSGLSPDRRAWLVKHPEFFDELSDFFADRDELEQLAAPLRQVAANSDLAMALEGLDPPTHPEHLGRLGPYEVTDWLGQGGMGVVFKAFDETLNRFVAIKLMAPQWSADAAARRRFSREAQAAAAISHPHVVTIHAVNEWRGRSYLVMEYISGPSLAQRIRERAPLELNEILWIGSQVASGLAAAHAQGLIHRDVKPGNIMLENDLPRVKLTDFGLARAVDDVKLTQHGILAGTPQYMAPEQAGGGHLDRRADLFSLGSVLYALCTGRTAFDGESTVEVIHRVCEGSPVPIERLNPEIPGWLIEIVARLHAKDPADRFQSAGDVALLLEKHLARLQDPSLPPVKHDWVKKSARAGRIARLRRIVQSRWAGVLFLMLLAARVTAELFRLATPTARPGAYGFMGMDQTEHKGSSSPATLPEKAEGATADGQAKQLKVNAPSPAPLGTPLSKLDETRLVQSYDQSFLEKSYDFRWLRISAPGGATSLVRPDPRGVRITIPAKLGESVAIETKFGIHGDFDLRAAYEVLACQQPTVGFGVGSELLVKPPGDWDKTASLSRFARPKDTAYSAVICRKVGERLNVQGTWPVTKATKGTLRLVRTGSTLHFLVAEGDSKEFREINQGELGNEDMEMARLSAVTGGSPSSVDVLWKSLTIRAEGLPGLPGSPTETNRFSWWLPVLGVLAAAVAGAGIWWRAAARRPAGKPVQKMAVPSPDKAGGGKGPGKKVASRNREGHS